MGLEMRRPKAEISRVLGIFFLEKNEAVFGDLAVTETSSALLCQPCYCFIFWWLLPMVEVSSLSQFSLAFGKNLSEN